MDEQTRVLTLNESDEWANVVQSFEPIEEDIYFYPDYFDLYCLETRGRPECFVFERGDTVALMPYFKRSLSNLPYDVGNKDYYDIEGVYGYNGPLMTGEVSDSFVKDFYECFDNYCDEENIVAEFMRSHPVLGNHKYMSLARDLEFDRPTVVSYYSEDEEGFNQPYDGDVRNKINKAQRNDISVVEAKSRDDYEEFHAGYTALMESFDAEDHYFYSLDYFLKIKESLPHKMYFAEHEGRRIAGILMIYSRARGSIHLSWRDLNHDNLGANNLLRHHLLDVTGNELGLQSIFHGGGNSSDPDDSLLRFKKGFSDETRDFYLVKHVHDKEAYQELVHCWEKQYPEKKTDYDDYFLRYRLC